MSESWARTSFKRHLLRLGKGKATERARREGGEWEEKQRDEREEEEGDGSERSLEARRDDMRAPLLALPSDGVHEVLTLLPQ